MRLKIRVNEELQLDAGHAVMIGEGDSRQRMIMPPQVTMFKQLLSYLDAKPNPVGVISGPKSGQEGVAAGALCLR